MITTVLAIETSCDETGVAVVQKKDHEITVLAQAVASQMDIHAATGGVVPEVAAREHVTVIRPLLETVLADSGVSTPDIAGIAVTVGPGLQPALAVGVTAARTLAYAWQKPVVPVNHLEGHIYSALLRPTQTDSIKNWQLDSDLFPAVALIVSGGHTLLVTITDHLTYDILGSTLDDAAGEAFDKVARLLGLPYPGGPALSKIAATGKPDAFAFPRPLIRSGDLNFSFSGLKTAVLYTWRKLSPQEQQAQLPDIAASFEAAVTDTLVKKMEQAITTIQPRLVLLAGGVAANQRLRNQLTALAQKHAVTLRIAPLALCGDNATMIGLTGVFAYEAGRTQPWPAIEPVARLPLTFAHQPATEP
jgi:N6-L-threonylcarbamoyladenine synthase